jgi:hypothetical protein
MARTDVGSPRNGLGLGVAAGAVLLVAEMIAAAVGGESLLTPLLMAGSVLLGQRAFTGLLGAAVVIGLLFHFILSAALGLAYTSINKSLSPEGRTSMARQAPAGMLFGLAVWLVDFQIIARLLYPWFLGPSQLVQALMHALFFGLPLGLLFAVGERRRKARQVPQVLQQQRTAP